MSCLLHLPGSLNDINILNRTSVFEELYEDRPPKCEYLVNDHDYKIGYFLLDRIYSNWATFVTNISFLQGPKAKPFAERQQLIRNVERAFGVS